VTELATNLVKHGAVNGRITAAVIEEKGRKGIRVVSEDDGPGIDNANLAMQDGFSTTGSIGSGLGAVNRLMDELEITSEVAGATDGSSPGTRIVCQRWLPKSVSAAVAKKELHFGVMVRSMSGEQKCGDAYFIHRYNGIHFVALMDGLGHGEKAFAAAAECLGFIRNNYRKDLKTIFEGAHEACRKTRGVALSVCRIDMDGNTFTYAGIGNVTTRVFDSPQPVNPTNFAGTLGVVLRHVHVFEYPWQGGILVMHTDGLKSQWSLNDLPELKSRPPAEIAATLMKQFGRDSDDVAVMVGK
jgi:hypothetical protein